MKELRAGLSVSSMESVINNFNLGYDLDISLKRSLCEFTLRPSNQKIRASQEFRRFCNEVFSQDFNLKFLIKDAVREYKDGIRN